MRFTWISTAGAALLIAVMVACVAEVPPAPTATPAATPTLLPPPTPTAAPAAVAAKVEPPPTPAAAPTLGDGICYRTPEIQDWIISQLNIPSCRLITEPELYRLQSGFAMGGLKPGDMVGFANVPSVRIVGAHCGDWANPDYARAMLEGLNREARLGIEYPLVVEYAGEDSNLPGRGEIHLSVMKDFIYPSSQSVDGHVHYYRYRNLDDLLLQAELLWDKHHPDGFSRTELAKWPAQAQGLKERINRLARDIAATIQAEGFGAGEGIDEDVDLPGRATIGDPYKSTGFVEVEVTLHRPYDVGDCPAAEE